MTRDDLFNVSTITFDLARQILLRLAGGWFGGLLGDLVLPKMPGIASSRSQDRYSGQVRLLEFLSILGERRQLFVGPCARRL